MLCFKTLSTRSHYFKSIFRTLSSLNTVSNQKLNSSNMGVPLAQVIQKLQEAAPLKLAGSWDNVGLLVEPTTDKIINNILLTIDLTEDVVDEAIDNKSQLIISYHPNIFKPLKHVTQSHWKERIVIKCIKNDIAIFSPHTTWDAMENGVNDWLGSVFKSKESKPLEPDTENPKLGMGRYLTLETPLSLRNAVESVKKHIGLPHLRVGMGRHKDLDSLIHTVALCAGSGASLLNGQNADLYLTGEMLHHDVLEATQKGIHVILCNHSDSERGFLKLATKIFQTDTLTVVISKKDRDCLTTM